MKRRRIREVKRGFLKREPYCYVFWIVGNTWDGLFFLEGWENCGTIYNQNFGILIFQVGILSIIKWMEIMVMQDGGRFGWIFYPKFEWIFLFIYHNIFNFSIKEHYICVKYKRPGIFRCFWWVLKIHNRFRDRKYTINAFHRSTAL